MLGHDAGASVRVRTPCGSVTAKKLVLALNAWMAEALPQFERSIAIVSSDMVITERCPELLRSMGLIDGVSVLDSRTFVHYYRSTEDGRLMLGKGGNTFRRREHVDHGVCLPRRPSRPVPVAAPHVDHLAAIAVYADSCADLVASSKVGAERVGEP